MKIFAPNVERNRQTRVIGIVGVAVFALIGNAVCYGSGFSRRYTQLLTLIVFAAVLLSSYAGHIKKIARAVRRPLAFGMLIAVLSTLPAVFSTEAHWSIHAIARMIIFAGWLALVFFARNSTTASEQPFTDNRFKYLFEFFLALALFLTFKAWWVGPPPGEVFMAFGGSTIIAGASATMLFF